MFPLSCSVWLCMAQYGLERLMHIGGRHSCSSLREGSGDDEGGLTSYYHN